MPRRFWFLKTCVGRVGHHMISHYRLALMMIIKQQCMLESESETVKIDSASSLAEAVDLNQVLKGRNIDLKSLQDPSIVPSLEEKFVEEEETSEGGNICGECIDQDCLNAMFCMPFQRKRDGKEDTEMEVVKPSPLTEN